MKTSTIAVCVALLSAASVPCIRFLDDPKEPPTFPVAAPNISNENLTKNLTGPAHEDNFQEEIVDQADPEFRMLSGGDDCINWTDAKKPYTEQFQKGAMGREIWTEEEKDHGAEAEKEILGHLRLQFNHADINGDGCINRTEFKAVMEMEGPPPGFPEHLNETMGEENLTKVMEEENRYEFDAMDRNHDGKISQSEAYHYASKNMPQAEIDEQELKTMFEEADRNGDKFISYKEFLKAGEAYDGDGDEMSQARPMTLFINVKKRGFLLPKMMNKASFRGTRMPKRHLP